TTAPRKRRSNPGRRAKPKSPEGSKKMSLYGALSIGVAGLQAYAQALSATSSNIANVNTVGYKEAQANFSTFLNSESGIGNNSSAGVVSSVSQDITTQGLPTTT